MICAWAATTFSSRIQNVISRSTHTILISGSLSDSVINNIVRHGPEGEAVTMEPGPQFVRNVKVAKVQATVTE